MEIIAPELRDFILFCVQRQGKEWPALYDEMTRVAGRRLFKGLGHSELKKMGLSFSLTDIGKTIKIIEEVLSQSEEILNRK